MKITVFTNNGIRHKYLVEQLKKNKFEVFLIQEKNVNKKYEKRSQILNEYFAHVSKAEKNIFNDILIENIEIDHKIEIEYGKLDLINLKEFNSFFQSDYYIVFGSSYIKGNLVDKLIENNCINLHMGISPYYRGSACNFWAQYDKNYNYIGGTIHKLSKGLDSGEILKIIKITPGTYEKFEIGMIAVKNTIDELINLLKQDKIKTMDSYNQNKDLEIRYSKIKDFDEKKAKEFLEDYKKNKVIEIKKC